MSQLNAKVLPGGTGWTPFPGFSCLFDPPDESHHFGELPDDPKLRLLKCQPGIALYDALAASAAGIRGALAACGFVPLPPLSYHVTVWDGVSVSDLPSLLPPYGDQFAAYLDSLPKSLLTQLPWSTPPQFNLGGQALTLQLKTLEIFDDAAALVALLEPCDSASRDLLTDIEEQRRHYYAAWEECGRRNPTKVYPYAPHVSLGYFPDSDAARAARANLASWSAAFRRATHAASISFDQISLYGFTNMSQFFKLA